ncbi:nucleolar protein 58-like [Gossypium hirsutum]|uniref:Nucleolar protein 58-like n=1 Tax=Gossypium hirsutum TaxID=3635 RepID=A0A1U8KCA6_GOSHI|nr:nucleolar protein 58-like [Gossypium hirsutum]
MTRGKDTLTMKEAETRKIRKGQSRKPGNKLNYRDIIVVQNEGYREKEEESGDIEECMRRIDSLVEGEVIAGKEAPTVEEKVAMKEEDVVHVDVVNEMAEEKNTKIEATEKESVEDIVNAFELMDTTKDDLELDRRKLQRPLKVTPPTQKVVDDTEAEELEEESEDRANPKERKRNHFKDKKRKKDEKKRRKKKHRAATLMAEEN